MNKEKLISLIIRKQTYKDTKTYLTQLAENSESAAKISAEAVKDILTTDYIAEAKLYAVRYLKDAFEKGNVSFVNQVESTILPILVGIAIDQTDEKAVIKYAGSSYTKAEELAKFKSILSSLFRMAKECIIKWAEWIPDPTRKFVDAANQLRKKNVSFQFQFKYFRPQNQQLFKEYSQKNGLKIVKNSKSNGAPAQPQTKKSTVPQPKQPSVYDPKKGSKTQAKKHKDPLAQKTELALQKISEATTSKQFEKLQNDFNQALNNYLQNAIDFQQDLVQTWFDEVENKKTEFMKKMQAKKPVQSEVAKQKNNALNVTPMDEQVATKPKSAIPNVQSKQGKARTKEVSKQVEKKVQVSKQSKVEFSQSSNKTSFISNDLSHIIKENIALDLYKIDNLASIQSQDTKTKKQIKVQIKQQPTKPIQNKQLKSPQSTSKIPKGPIVFDDVQEESIPKIPTKQKVQKSNTLNVPNAKSLNELSKGQKAKEQLKSVKQSELSRQQQSSKQIKNVVVSKVQPKSSSLKSQQKPPVLKLAKPNQQTKKGKSQDMSISKESQRVDFSSEDEHSQFSQEAIERPEVLAFKKKVNLAQIEEENDSRFSENKTSSIPPILRTAREQQAKRGNAAANKLLQQNTLLYQKIQKMAKQVQSQKQQKLIVQKEKLALQKQLSLRIQNQEKYLKRIKASVPLQDYNKLKRQLQQEKSERNSIQEQLVRLKKELQQQRIYKNKLQDQNERRRYQQEKMNEQYTAVQERYNKNVVNKVNQKEQKTKVIPNNSNLDPNVESRIVSEYPSQKTVVNSPIKREPVDEDYIKNLTHPSNIHAWLNQVNINLFKKNVLDQSEIFYRDDYLTLLCKCNVYTQNDQQFLSIQMNFQFKAIKQVIPQVKYRNCQELDLWTKPLAGEHPLFKQQLVVKLHRNPLKILKGQVKIVQGLVITFLMPFMYYSFLREQEFSPQQFDQIFNAKSQQLIKSKIVQLNSTIFKQSNDLQKIFRNCTVSENKIRFCLSEGISDQVFLGQFQLLRNSKVILRMLAIPSNDQMLSKARELLENIIFLVS